MKKKKYIGLAVAIVVTVLVASYVGLALFFQSHFCFGTTINGIAVGGCSAEQVEQLIRSEVDSYTLTLQERDGEEQIESSSIALEPVFQGEIETLLEQQQGYTWVAVLFQGASFELANAVNYDQDALRKQLADLDCMDRQQDPVDAYCSDYSETDGYTLVPSEAGTKLNQTKLLAKVEDAIEALASTLDLDAAGCYVAPSVQDDDASLLALIDKMNSYVTTTITYEFGSDTEVLDADTIHTWLSADSGQLVVDKEAVLAFVKTLASKYNTAYKPKTLATSYGKTITISNGSYGWRIDNDGEVQQILEDLEEGGSISREPVYAQTANSHGENDYGNSYVEINLTAQHLFLYKNGSLVLESDFVSGSVAGNHQTHTGAFGLTYKTLNAVLRGPDYETPVTYWMPFNGDEGMHDATWRSKFGGSIYKTNGSHGCINLPKSVAKQIYETIDKGYPVLVYNLAGTESQASQQADAATVINYIAVIGEVTLESENAIAIARTLYNALDDSQKALVTNYDTLVAAEAALAQLKAQQEAEAAAAAQAAAEQAAAEQAAAAQAAADAAAAGQP